jgi:hypothetical protein
MDLLDSGGTEEIVLQLARSSFNALVQQFGQQKRVRVRQTLPEV